MNKPLCIHVGLHKAASATLVNDFFHRHPGVTNIGKPWEVDPLAKEKRRTREFIEYLLFTDYAHYDAQEARRLYEQAVAPFLSPEKPVTISDGKFASSPGIDHSLVAHRLREAVGEARIIIVIRRQLDFLCSLYVHHSGLRKAAGSFTDWLTVNWALPHNNYLAHLDYFSLVESYVRLFGREYVGVFLFEELARDSAAFARGLCAFIGIDPEEGARVIRGGHQMPRLSRLQHVVGRSLFLSGLKERVGASLPDPAIALARKVMRVGGPIRPRYTEEWRARLEDHFRDGNRRLAETYGLALGEHGYAM